VIDNFNHEQLENHVHCYKNTRRDESFYRKIKKNRDRNKRSLWFHGHRKRRTQFRSFLFRGRNSFQKMIIKCNWKRIYTEESCQMDCKKMVSKKFCFSEWKKEVLIMRNNRMTHGGKSWLKQRYCLRVVQF